MTNPRYRPPEAQGDESSKPSVQSVSISRRTASRSARYGRGGKRTVTRGKRRFEAAVGQLEVAGRLRRAGLASVGLRGTPWRRSKIVGILVALVAAMAITAIHTSDAWFVYADDIEVRNLTYLDSAEIVRQSAIGGWHIMWLTPESVRERVLTNQYIEDATVGIRAPAHVTIDVRELKPVALWVTNNGTYWLTGDGTALPAIASTDESLPQLIDPVGEAQAITTGPDLAVDTNVLESALALMQRVPDLNNKIRFNKDVGLNFPLPGQDVWVYWGDGEDTETKLVNLKAAETLLAGLEEPATIVDVRYLERPYFR